MQSINNLIRNITDGTRAAHAFAAEGRAGESRETFIRTLTAGLLCSSEDPQARPCGRCPSCLQVNAGTSMDLIRMNKSQGSSKSGRETYKVDDAAAFIERLSMGSYGRYLIGIIDDADSLSETIQNKLLKTLEEPSPDTLIILGISNRDNLLSTVQSRLSFVRMADYEGFGSSEEEGGEFAEDDSAFTAAAEKTAELFTSGTAAFYEVRNSVEKNIKNREDALILLDMIENRYRDAMTAAGMGEIRDNPAAYAYAIERVNITRMDIRREMNHIRALKRLYLELTKQ